MKIATTLLFLSLGLIHCQDGPEGEMSDSYFQGMTIDIIIDKLNAILDQSGDNEGEGDVDCATFVAQVEHFISIASNAPRLDELEHIANVLSKEVVTGCVRDDVNNRRKSDWCCAFLCVCWGGSKSPKALSLISELQAIKDNSTMGALEDRGGNLNADLDINQALDQLTNLLGNEVDNNVMYCIHNQWQARDQRARLYNTFHCRFSKERRCLFWGCGRWYCTLKRDACKQLTGN